MACFGYKFDNFFEETWFKGKNHGLCVKVDRSNRNAMTNALNQL